MINNFLNYLRFEKRYSDKTISSYQNDLTQFELFCSNEYELTALKSVSYAIIRSWLVSLMEQKLTETTVNRKIAALRSFYKFLLLKGDITENPTKKIVSPKTKKKLPSFFSEKEIVELLENSKFENSFSGHRNHLILALLYGTGIRLSELINLKIDDISTYEKTIKVIGKGNKERLLPVHKELWQHLTAYITERKNFEFNNICENLLLTDKGKILYPMFVYRIVKEHLTKVTTLEKKHPHLLRHTFATHLLNRGADLNAIKELLGHSSLAATQVYTHNSTEKLKKIFKHAHPKA